MQITSGEVTLLKPDALGRIVRYAREIGLDPMIMTNGQRLLQVPDYLSRLVRDYGLQKISFHEPVQNFITRIILINSIFGAMVISDFLFY